MYVFYLYFCSVIHGFMVLFLLFCSPIDSPLLETWEVVLIVAAVIVFLLLIIILILVVS